MISSVFPLVDIFCMQTSWATHVINIMALNNCDQNSCGVGLHNPEHFLYLMHPIMTTKIFKLLKIFLCMTLDTLPNCAGSSCVRGQLQSVICDHRRRVANIPIQSGHMLHTLQTHCLTLNTSQLNSRSSQYASSLFLFSLPLITCMHLHLLVVY